MKLLLSVILVILSNTCVIAQDMPEAMTRIVNKYQNVCKKSGSGKLILYDKSIVQVDLNLNSKADWILDVSYLFCETDQGQGGQTPVRAGSAGSPIEIFVDGSHSSVYARSWKITSIGLTNTPVLLLEQSGIVCGGDGTLYCVEALVWDRGKLQSVRHRE